MGMEWEVSNEELIFSPYAIQVLLTFLAFFASVGSHGTHPTLEVDAIHGCFYSQGGWQG